MSIYIVNYFLFLQAFSGPFPNYFKIKQLSYNMFLLIYLEQAIAVSNRFIYCDN
jgi:hypothetical protein